MESNNSYDWLGHGIYFWEGSLQHAVDWAAHRFHESARVIGVVLDLGYCLELTDYASASLLHMAYEQLMLAYDADDKPLPRNRAPRKDGEVILRDLDCAIINMADDIGTWLMILAKN